jgi:hypothetical protein
MVREGEYVVNVVIATLAHGSVATGGRWYRITNLCGPLKLDLVGW